MRRTGIILILAATLGLSPAHVAEDMEVPVDLQLNIFAKVLRFDRSLSDRPSEELVLGVLYQSRVRDSDLAKDQIVDLVRKAGLTVQDRPVKVVPLTAETPADLDKALEDSGIEVLYVGPLRAFNASRFAEVTRAHSVLTLTGVPQFVEDGLSIGVGLVADRPEIIINVDAARLEGADLQARLLQLARIVQDKA